MNNQRMTAPQPLVMHDALVPLVGQNGYRQLIRALYNSDLLHQAGAPSAFVQALETWRASHDIESIPRQEAVLDSDSKSRVYVVQTTLESGESWTWVLKWYNGKRQQQAPIEARMNLFFQQRLAPDQTVVPILDVLPLSDATDSRLSIALLPYMGDMTLYDRLHQLPRHDPQAETLLQQASHTLAVTQVIGRLGHDEQTLKLTSLAPSEAPAYFLGQIDSALLQSYAASGSPLEIGETLMKQFAFFARVLGDDSSSAGLYYRGINPRNVMLVDDQQAEIDFEQDSLRSRFIDIVSLLENGLEMTEWNPSADYLAYNGQLPFATWQCQYHHAQAILARYNYLSHEQIDRLTAAFIDTTSQLEHTYLQPPQASYSATSYQLILETARLFRHLQYVGYCKRNEFQTHAPHKRLSSRYRQHLHALWAKVALDTLIYPPDAKPSGLPEAERQSAMALRHTLDRLPLETSTR